MSNNQKQKMLWKLCENFISNLEIGSSETIYQSDKIYEESPDFIRSICDIVGYHEFPEDE